MTRIPLILSLLALLPASAIAQNTWYVPDDFPTIQTGIDGSVNGDTVIVRDGTYLENINFNGMAITLKSENGPATTIIDGNQAGSVVTIESGEGSDSVFEGFTVTNGNATHGGGMYCYQSSPTLDNCTFTDNIANDEGGGMYCYDTSFPTLIDCTFTNNTATLGSGGGMYCYQSSPTLDNCTFTNNTANDEGGGIRCYGSSPTLDNCMFTNNTAYDGGGMSCAVSSPTLENCTFADNTGSGSPGVPGGYGGGMYCNNFSSPTLDNCTFTGNTADFGGGIRCYQSSSPTLNNCTFTDNIANDEGGGGVSCYNSSDPILNNCTFTNNTATYGSGGGMMCNGSSPTLNNCTFANNTADDGGGMFCENSSPALKNCTFTANTGSIGSGIHSLGSPAPTLSNCIVWGNVPTNIEGGADGVTYSCVQGGLGHPWFGPNCIDTDPLFIDPVNDDFHLQAGSPCIDTGDPNSSLDPDGTRADMGAFYFDQSPTLSVSNLVAGQQVLVEVNDATPNNFSHFAWSIHGGGPTPTPWGDAMVTPPYNLKLLPTDSTGYASYTANIPLHAAGVTVWCHGTDVGTQSMLNALMLVIQ